jgi:tripeptide aminopeptidase
MNTFDFDQSQAISWLLRFMAIEGITGQEKAIGQEVEEALVEAGIPRRSIRVDNANQRIPLPTQTGNLIVTLPGTLPGPRRLFACHLDTVPLCAGAQPKRKGGRVVAAGETALGGDNRTGVACLVTLAATLVKNKLPHPPLTMLFTVREESGLFGARYVDLTELGRPVMGFNVDGRLAYQITVGAVGAVRWDAEILGKAAHAGVHPEQGISATIVGALALADIHQRQLFGKYDYEGKPGTSNVGSFGGCDGKSAGIATNVVTDYALVRGEIRSHSARVVRAVTAIYHRAFKEAARKVCDHRGKPAKIKFTWRRDYHAFRLREEEPVVQMAFAAARAAGFRPELRIANGGLDANWLVRHGIPTITFGAGQNNIHTVDEFVELADYLAGCRMALALATQES